MTRPARHLLTSLWSAAALIPVAGANSGVAATYRTLFVTLRRLVLGRRLTVQLDDGDLTVTVARFDSRLDVRGFVTGELTDVRLIATDIRWRTAELEQAEVTLRHVHVLPGPPPVLVAAPVEVSIDVPAGALGDLVGDTAARWTGEIDEDGVGRIRFARRPRLGHVEVDVGITSERAGTTLWVRAVALGSGRWRMPVRTPAYRIRLPELAHGLRLTGVQLTPGVVRVDGAIPQWQLALDRKRLEDIVTGLRYPSTSRRAAGRRR
jgi:hypothetical protein